MVLLYWRGSEESSPWSEKVAREEDEIGENMTKMAVVICSQETQLSA